MLVLITCLHHSTLDQNVHQNEPHFAWRTFAGVVCVSAGGAHSAAVTADGNLLVWGCNDGGALGVALGTDHLIQPWVQS